MPLTDTKIRTSKSSPKAQKLTDSHGLYLMVQPSGSKLWRYRYRIDGKENVFAMGEYCLASPGETENRSAQRRAGGRYTLTEARREREKCRALVKGGVHPAQYRKTQKMIKKQAQANTFEAVAEEWVGKKRGNWSVTYTKQVERILGRDIYPKIGELPIKEVPPPLILEILQSLEARGAKTVALLARQICSSVFRYAAATLRADSDPAAMLQGSIERDKVQHRKPLSAKEIPEFLEKVESYGGYRPTIIALKLALLTFVRPVELRTAEWTELDLGLAEWRIPAHKMKMRELHVVPLSSQAVELFKELQTFTGGRNYLFPNLRSPKRCMTPTTLNRAIERLGYGGHFSAHGFRATASTLLNEIGYRPEVIERQLAHKERNKVRASYNQAEYMEERRKMMQWWADYMDALKDGGNIISGRFGKVV